MKIAFVYDRINKWGGAERVLLALHDIWPDAPLYTAVYDANRAPWARVFDVRPSFLQHFPLAKSHHELYPWLTQLAFESFSFDEFDVVLSVTSAEAKAVVTKPHTVHVCYCLTPTRYLWSGYEAYQKTPGFGEANQILKQLHKYIVPTLRRWDRVASSRPDYYIAISKTVKKRIETYYKRDVSDVIYPPVDTKLFSTHNAHFSGGEAIGYYLAVSRLVGHKRIDLIIEAANKLVAPLVIIGEGYAEGELKKLAGPTVRFITNHLTDSELSSYYGNCRGFLTMADEDFGISTVEALASGRPVIGYKKCGTGEIVKDGITGVLVNEQTTSALVEAIERFEKMTLDPIESQKESLRFDQKNFSNSMKKTIETLRGRQTV